MRVLLRVFKLGSSSENVEIINRIDKMSEPVLRTYLCRSYAVFVP